MNEKKSSTTDVYAMVNNRITKQIEKGIVPWQQPWGDAGLPKNLITGRPYRGINVWLLNPLGYEQNYFLTSHQIKEIGATIKEGEKGNMTVFWKWLEVKDEGTDQIANVPFLRYNSVYNIAQCDGIPETQIPMIDLQNNPLKACEDIIMHMQNLPKIKHKENKSYYNPLLDFVNIPKEESFDSKESYFSKLFVELVHSTGHQSRVNRKEVMQQKAFGAEPYSTEEFMAEIGACYLKSFAGFGKEHFSTNEADMKGWLEKIKNDRRFIVYASTLAQKATDYILNISYQSNETPTQSESKLEEIPHGSDDLPF